MSIHALDNRAPSDFTLKSTGFSHNMSWCHMMSGQIITYAVLAFAFKTWIWIQNLPHLVQTFPHHGMLRHWIPCSHRPLLEGGQEENRKTTSLEHQELARQRHIPLLLVEQNRPTFWFGHCAADSISKPSFFIFFQYEYPCVWILALASHCLFG